jgi:hypothetical protein
VTGREVEEEELRAAVERLSGGDGLEQAERVVATVLPELRLLLADALGSGGWFGQPHQAETLRVATIPDSDERLEALRNLLEEETNIGMMVGVAVGWALRTEIGDPVEQNEGEE